MAIPDAVRRVLVVTLLGLGARAGAQEPQTEWTLSLRGQESRELEREFNGVAQDDLILDSVNGELRLLTHTERSRFGLFGRVGSDLYRTDQYEDRLNFGAGLSWDYTGERFDSFVTFSIDRGLTAETLSTLGVLAPGVNTDTIDTTWDLSYRKSSRTTLSTQISYNYIQFDVDQSIPGSQVVLPQSPFREQFSPLLGAPTAPSDPGTIELPNPEESVLGILATEGFIFPNNRSHWATAIFGLASRVSEYTTLGFDLGGAYRTINNGFQDLREGSEGGFRVWTQRRVGKPSTIGLSYEFHRSLVLEPANTVQSLVAGYSYAHPEKELFLRLSGGASHFQRDPIGDLFTPIVDAQFSAGITRSTHFGALYQRQFAQALGFGETLLIDYGNVSLTQDFGTKVSLTLLASGSFGRVPLIENSRYDLVQAGGTLTYNVVKSFQLGTSFFVLDTEQTNIIATSLAETRRNLWTVFALYTATWR